MDVRASEFRAIVETLRRATAALRDAQVPYALGGSVATWARGGPETVNDLDLHVARDDADAASEALQAVGMRCLERPPEGWLLKVADGDVVVDLIYEITGIGDARQVIERAETMRVASIDVPVSRIEDVLTPKLRAFDEHYLEFAGTLRVVRALREQIDWPGLEARTADSPYARGFLALCRELGVAPSARPAGPAPGTGSGPSVRVVL